ncbi:MAG TPA: hypothetical protein VLC49_07930 [Solirubrobacteraceae bacterium]|nr:hypothetical protein [Solirubrobacteraceae bacterium]
MTAAVLALVGAAVAFAATRTSTSHYGYGMMGRSYVYRPAQAIPVRTLAAASTQAQKFADRLGLKVDEVLQFKDNFYAKLVDSSGNGATEVLVDPHTGAVSIEYGPAMMWNTKYGMGHAAAGMMGRYGRSMMRDYGGPMMGATGSTASRPDATASPGYGPGMMGGSEYSGMMGGPGHGPDSAGSGGTSNSTAVTMAKAHSLAQQWLDRHEPGVKVETGGDAFPGYYTLETLRGGKITGMISVNATTGAVWPHWWHGAFIAKS